MTQPKARRRLVTLLSVTCLFLGLSACGSAGGSANKSSIRVTKPSHAKSIGAHDSHANQGGGGGASNSSPTYSYSEVVHSADTSSTLPNNDGNDSLTPDDGYTWLVIHWAWDARGPGLGPAIAPTIQYTDPTGYQPSQTVTTPSGAATYNYSYDPSAGWPGIPVWNEDAWMVPTANLTGTGLGSVTFSPPSGAPTTVNLTGSERGSLPQAAVPSQAGSVGEVVQYPGFNVTINQPTWKVSGLSLNVIDEANDFELDIPVTITNTSNVPEDFYSDSGFAPFATFAGGPNGQAGGFPTAWAVTTGGDVFLPNGAYALNGDAFGFPSQSIAPGLTMSVEWDLTLKTADGTPPMAGSLVVGLNPGVLFADSASEEGPTTVVFITTPGPALSS